ncbi:hypothetical protein [Nocardia asteroides]|uniref:hypothetical protein n=1 Tax=Nocardia asteroides TaxID=1824 RepID=UPI001E45E1BA|nr:hypothetical protein [Nocardia asteroides]UGT56044.1 hypothetical protein LTT85_03915 [Nocardia asteroides]
MLITALVLALAGLLRRVRGRREAVAAPGVPRQRRAVAALRRQGRAVAAARRGAIRLVREPVPALSAAVTAFGLAIVGTHLLCAGSA